MFLLIYLIAQCPHHMCCQMSNGSIIVGVLGKIVRMLLQARDMACMIESKNTDFLLANLNVRGHS